ncbi:MAG: amino acid ABC transporter permease [Oscillospiraceae bacterium]
MAEVFAKVFTPDNIRYLLGGLQNTVIISVCVIAISIVFGTILALMRNYDKFIAGKLAAVYIEIFRNTPLLLWILMIRFMTRIPGIWSGVTSMSLFTSAIMAEIIRGGLNSVPQGQFEAAKSQGFSFMQTLLYIVIPQCFKNIVPSLLSQVITAIKDSSFLAQVAIAEFTRTSQVIMGRFTTSAEVFVMYGSIAATYFVVNFALSCIVRYEKKSKKVSASPQ